MKKLSNVQIYSFALLIISSLSFTNISNAESDKRSEIQSVKIAFQSINNAIYAIEETKNYCSSQFSDDNVRNTEAFETWELQHSFFLREFDKNYSRWKLGFTTLEQQQFASLEFIQRQIIREEIIQEYAEGSRDKCYNFKPSLSRPRSNLELSYQNEFNFIRNQSFNGFINARDEGTSANESCAWQQEHALKIIGERNEGKDIKYQKAQLKTFKNAIDTSIDKKEQALRIKHYGDMINEAYQAPAIQALSFSQYRFSLCEQVQKNMDVENFKNSLPLILECQNKSSEYSDLLGQCISQALIKK